MFLVAKQQPPVPCLVPNLHDPQKLGSVINMQSDMLCKCFALPSEDDDGNKASGINVPTGKVQPNNHNHLTKEILHEDYDDTDKGVLWKPRTDQVLRAIGKVNNKGEEKNTLLMACQTKDGEKYYELYQKVSPIYIKADANPNAPDFSGPFGEDRRIAFCNELLKVMLKREQISKASVTDKMTSDTTNDTANITTQTKLPTTRYKKSKTVSKPDQWDDQF